MTRATDQPTPGGRNDEQMATYATTRTRSTKPTRRTTGMMRAERARRASRPAPKPQATGARPGKPSEAWRPGRFRTRRGRPGLFLCHIRPLSEVADSSGFGVCSFAVVAVGEVC